MELVTNTFLVENVEAILSFPVGVNQVVDSLMWHYEKSGIYSVKHGYRVRCALKDTASASGFSGTKLWWKFLWRVEIPLKNQSKKALKASFYVTTLGARMRGSRTQLRGTLVNKSQLTNELWNSCPDRHQPIVGKASNRPAKLEEQPSDPSESGWTPPPPT
ncbi:hypothetical protein Dsin_032549 [Dipteronia sinensis]|uniref:Uncharacterized protein n=1 Tax=Dipteronia sinensis TaxID=43782 RepID=A0AAD9ZCS8_9ROSI|nr:hypothetical protein Dsin_032549 [Dipteronia sinensis]